MSRLALGVLLLSAGMAWAQDPVQLLRRTADVRQQPTYCATRVVLFANQKVVTHIFYAGPGSERQEAGTRRQVLYVRNGNTAWYTGSRVTVADPRRYHLLSEQLSIPLVTRNYHLKLVGRGVVAGRPAYCLLCTPLLGDRPTTRLWLDQETGLMLRKETLSPAGRLQCVEYLAEIKFQPQLPQSLFQPPAAEQPKHAASLSLADIEKKLGRKLALPHRMPGGFVLGESRLVQWAGHTFAHLCYSDGLSTLSLFELPAADAEAGSQGIAWLTAGPLINLLTWTGQGMHLTLAANLPERQLCDIAASVR